jgi:hypothetical protein
MDDAALQRYLFVLCSETSTAPLPPASMFHVHDAEFEPLLLNLCLADADDEALLLRRLESRCSESEEEALRLDDDLEYSGVIAAAERAIVGGIPPLRIRQGSSGSYFVRNERLVSAL